MSKKYFFTFIIIFLNIIFFNTQLSAQKKGIIRGNVYEKDNGQPVAYATVRIEDTNIGTQTDVDGFFTIPNLPYGKYNLVCNYLGFDSIHLEIDLNTSIIYKSLYLKESNIELGAVEITAEKEIAKTEVQISRVSVTPKQIKSLPSIGGEADIAQYLSVLPGVINTGDQGGQFYIRGGAPVQNRILIDGMTIFNPFHSIGFYSVFETEAIKNVDVQTGGFNAENGGRVSAIIDITTRDGDKKKFGGLVATNPFASKVLIEGPIIKLREDSRSSISYLFTSKYSYIDKISKSLYSYVPNGLPYSFQDFYGKISLNTNNGTKLNVFGFSFNDNVDFSSLAQLNWKSYGVGSNFTLLPQSSNMIINGRVSFSKYNIQLNEQDNQPRYNAINNFNTGLDFTYFGPNNEIKYGFDIGGFQTDFNFTNALGFIFSQTENVTELAAFVKYRQKIGFAVIEPSLRFQYYASLQDAELEPRLGVKLNLTDWMRFKFAGGFYSQNLISTVNERDIVNLFVGFLAGPEQRIQGIDGADTKHRLQKAIHAIAGFEFDITPKLQLNVEPYYKKFTQVININRNKIVATDAEYAAEVGDAYGLDWLVKYKQKNFDFWLSYSLGKVTRDDGTQVYPTNFDRRHNVNLVMSYYFGKKHDWEASMRWNFGTGFPFTLTQGFYSYYNFENGVATDVLTGNADQIGIVYSSKRNSGRLPDYHRLDLNLKKTIKLSVNSNLEASIGVTNAYNRQNIFYFNRVTYKRVDQLPILPNAGLKITF
ncbi:MAG: TonB-dependent receptor [Saprospiraceae bacterium]|nr:TonB-dependent receptor [Saprospiraceae bacterium]